MLEYGVVVGPQGQRCQAMGASVHGDHVTGYLASDSLALTQWAGKTMLVCRAEVVETYRHEWIGDPMAIVYRLGKGRWIVGYALGHGMLFRGRLLLDCDEREAKMMAKQEAEYWWDLDAEDDERDQAEQEAERIEEERLEYELAR